MKQYTQILHILLEEICKLRRDRTFTRNLILTTIFAIAYSLTLAQINRLPMRIGKKEKIADFSHTVSAGLVIRVCESFYR